MRETNPLRSHIVKMATAALLDRRHGITQPAAEYDPSIGRWIPSPSELQECCTRVSPAMLYQHCKSLEHLANLYGVSPQEIRGEIRRGNRRPNRRDRENA